MYEFYHGGNEFYDDSEDPCDDLENEPDYDDFDDSMDGDFDSGMASAGLGMDEDYNHYDYGEEF